MQNYRRSGIFGRKAGTGKWKISTPEQDARLVAEVERNPFHTAASLKAVDHFPGHEQTVRNRSDLDVPFLAKFIRRSI